MGVQNIPKAANINYKWAPSQYCAKAASLYSTFGAIQLKVGSRSLQSRPEAGLKKLQEVAPIFYLVQSRAKVCPKSVEGFSNAGSKALYSWPKLRSQSAQICLKLDRSRLTGESELCLIGRGC